MVLEISREDAGAWVETVGHCLVEGGCISPDKPAPMVFSEPFFEVQLKTMATIIIVRCATCIYSTRKVLFSPRENTKLYTLPPCHCNVDDVIMYS